MELGGGEASQEAESAIVSASKNSGPGRKLVTQGEADNLTLSQMKEHTTLNFEINKARRKKKKKSSKTASNLLCNALQSFSLQLKILTVLISVAEVVVPVLPPPPKSPMNVRKNPFNEPDSSEDETDAKVREQRVKENSETAAIQTVDHNSQEKPLSHSSNGLFVVGNKARK